MKAKYHQDADTVVTLDVLKKHSDGTVDLGQEKVLLVSRCPVSEDGKPGTVTLPQDLEAKAVADKAAADKAAADKAAADKAAADKAAADKAAADKAAADKAAAK
jgi:membrane protein involved in colicin uptake